MIRLMCTLAAVISLNTAFAASTSKQEMTVFLHENNESPFSISGSSLILGSVNPSVYSQIFRMSEAGDLLPGLVQKWSFDFKKNEYTLTLGDHYFHNGRKLSSADLEFSLVRPFIGFKNAFTTFYLTDILGVEDLTVGTKYKSGLIKGIRIVDNKTIRIKLKRKSPGFLSKLSIPILMVVPIEELKDSNYYDWKRQPIGAGPYRVKKDYQDHEAILERVTDSGTLPKTIVLHTKRKLQKYDLLFENAPNSDAEKSFPVSLAKNPASFTGFFFNSKRKLGNDENFRNAIYYGIDREKAVLDSNQLKPTSQVLFKMQGGGLIRNVKQNPYQPELAKSYLKKVPASLLANPVRVSVYSLTKGFFPPVIAKQVIEIQRQLEEIGLKIEFDSTSNLIMNDDELQKYDMRFSTRVVDAVNPLLIFSSMVRTSFYSVEMPLNGGDLDQLYTDAELQETNDGLVKSLRKIADRIDEKRYLVPVFQRYSLFRTNPDTIKTLGNQPRPHYLDFSLIELK
jgi:ABC-type transport system substrate-binding protein